MDKIMVYFDFPQVTVEQYDKVWEELRNAGHSNPKGLLYHAGAKKGNGVVVVDIWESQEKFEEFGKTLMPIMEKSGAQIVQPVILPLHNEYKG